MQHRVWQSSIPFKLSGIIHMKSTEIKDAATPISEFDGDPKLEAARIRLQASFEEGDALESVREIVANLLGSEEMGLYRVDNKKAVLWLYWSFGIDPEKFSMLDVLTEPVVQQVMAGEAFIDHAGAGELAAIEQSVTAFIPIRFEDRTLAILAIFRLLPQKATLDDSDIELFNILATEGGKSLFNPNSKSFISRTSER
jgi:GAF domain-containing protein